MGRTACTEPQCLYNGALYLYLYYSYVLRPTVEATDIFYGNHMQESRYVFDFKPQIFFTGNRINKFTSAMFGIVLCRLFKRYFE